MNSKSRNLFETLHKIKLLDPHDILCSIPKSEFFTLGAIINENNPCIEERPFETEEVRVCEIAEKLRISPPAVSRILRHLEEKGYISRTVDNSDRRNTFVKATKLGEQIFNSNLNEMSDFIDKTLTHLEPDEVDDFLFLLNKLYNGIKLEIDSINKPDSSK